MHHMPFNPQILAASLIKEERWNKLTDNKEGQLSLADFLHIDVRSCHGQNQKFKGGRYDLTFLT